MKKLVSKYKGYTFYEYLDFIDDSTIKYFDTGVACGFQGNTLKVEGKYSFKKDTNKRQLQGFSASADFYWGTNNNIWESTTTPFGDVDTVIFSYCFDDINTFTTTKGLKKNENNWSYSTSTLVRGESAWAYIKSNYKIGNIITNNLYQFQGKVYFVNVYLNDNLVRKFIPASNSDGVLGLYDLVNDVFYTNQGTGSFTVGERINIEVDIDSEIKGRWNTKNLAQLIYYDANNNPYGLQNNDFIYDSYKPNKISAKANYTSGGNKFFSAFKVYLKPNTNYVISMSSDSHTYGAATQLYLYSDNLWGNRIASYGLSIATGNKRLITATDIIEGWYVIGIYNVLTSTDYTDILIKDFMIEEGEVATDYVPYIQTAKEIKTTAPHLNPSIVSNTRTVAGVTGTFDGNNLDFKGTNNAADSNISFSSYYRVPILKFGKYIFETTCIRRNEKGVCQFYIYGKKNGSNYYYTVGANHTVGTKKRIILDLKDDMLQNNATSFFVYPQIIGTKGDIVDCAYTFRVIPIVTAKEIKTKIDGELKTICLDYELAEDVQVSTISALNEDDVNEIQT